MAWTERDRIVLLHTLAEVRRHLRSDAPLYPELREGVATLLEEYEGLLLTLERWEAAARRSLETIR